MPTLRKVSAKDVTVKVGKSGVKQLKYTHVFFVAFNIVLSGQANSLTPCSWVLDF